MVELIRQDKDDIAITLPLRPGHAQKQHRLGVANYLMILFAYMIVLTKTAPRRGSNVSRYGLGLARLESHAIQPCNVVMISSFTICKYGQWIPSKETRPSLLENSDGCVVPWAP